MFFSKSFIVLALTLRPMIQFYLTFYIWCEIGVQFHSFACIYTVILALFV